MQWYTDVIKKYVEFSGRARRQEFWMFNLINAVIWLVLLGIDNAIGTDQGQYHTSGILSGIYSLAVLLPSIAVAIRRMHDTNRTGWWVLINLICCIGWIIFIVFAAKEGDAGANQYGPDPKGPGRGPDVPPAPQEPGYPTV
jgi:uncharacterized membrane protein YhaH (DUF805 family)